MATETDPKPNGNGVAPHDSMGMYGAMLEKQRGRPRGISVEIGRPGLKVAAGHLYEEFLPALRGQQAIRTYNEMSMNDALISGLLFAITSILTGVGWHAEPQNPSKKDDVEAAKFVAECVRDLGNTWSDFIAEALSMLIFGWSYFEVTYKLRSGRSDDPASSSRFDDRKWGWKFFSPRAQESLYSWEYDPATERLIGMVQTTAPKYAHVLIPVSRALHFRLSPQKDSPEGRSLLRGAYRAWYFKRRLQELEAIGVERDLAGLPVFYVDPRLFFDPDYTSHLEDWKNVVVNLRRDEQEGVVIPNVRDESGNRLYELTLLSTGSRRQSASNDIIERYNTEIAMSALADFMLLGHTKTGAFALSKTKTDLFSTAFTYVLDVVANELNEREIPRVLALNVMKGEARLVHGKVGHTDLEKFSSMIHRLAQSGIPLLSQDGSRERFILEELGLPAGDIGEAGTRVPMPSDPGVSPTSQRRPTARQRQRPNGQGELFREPEKTGV